MKGGIHVLKVVKTNFVCTRSDLDRLYQCNRDSAKIWNYCVDLAKHYYTSTGGRWISKSLLQKSTKGLYHMHSQSIQAVCHKYLFARDSIRAARAKGFTNLKYPYKHKNNFNTKWANNGFEIIKNESSYTILLKMGLKDNKLQRPIKVKVASLPACTIKEIELVFEVNKLMLCLSYEDNQVVNEQPPMNTAAVDLGEIHSIASVCTNGKSIIITGRKARSIKQLRNKKLAELSTLMSHCKKGSRNYKKYKKAYNYIRSKADRQLTDLMHKQSHNFVEWCVQNQVSSVLVGNPEGVQRHISNKNKKSKRPKTKLVNQKLSQWQFGKLYSYLEYKLKEKDISIEKVDESYSTQTCPVCGKKHKCSSRTYKCSCGYKEHRDIHGAKNILAKHLYGKFTNISVAKRKYLRVA